MEAIQNFTTKVAQWNKECFANILHRKRQLLAQLEGIQEALEIYDSNSLVRLEWKLQRELEKLCIKKNYFGIRSLEKSG